MPSIRNEAQAMLRIMISFLTEGKLSSDLLIVLGTLSFFDVVLFVSFRLVGRFLFVCLFVCKSRLFCSMKVSWSA